VESNHGPSKHETDALQINARFKLLLVVMRL